MNRSVVFLWGPLATLAVLAGGLVLVRVYLAEATELLVAELTGAGARVERMDVSWLPPSVTLYGLKLDTGAERIEAPRIELYPDLSGILHGEVRLSRAVLDRPLIRAALSGGGPGRSVNPALLPQSLSLHDAAFVADRDGTPVAFSVDLEKEAVGIGFVVRNAEVPEFGLHFAGTVEMRSTAPLALTVEARQGTFNPAKLFDFLRRFDYLDEAWTAMFAGTERIAAREFRLDFDAKTGAASFVARSLALDDSTLADFDVGVDPKGGWTLACKEGTLDAAQMAALLTAHPDGGRAFADGLEGLGLRTLAAEGVVGLDGVRVRSAGGRAKPAGSLSLSSPSLKLSLVSEKGETQDVTLKDLAGTVTLKNGRAMVSVDRLEFASSAGGTGALAGESPVPFVLAGTRFKAEARRLDWFGTVLDGTASKGKGRQIDFDFTASGSGTQVAARGLARAGYGGAGVWAAVFDDLVIRTAEAGRSDDAEPFDFGFVRDSVLSGKIVARRLQYNDLPVVRDLSARVASADGKVVAKGRGRLCLMRVGLELALVPDSLTANVAVTGNGVQLPGVLGCFVDELPVYLRGRLSVQALFSVRGRSLGEVRESLRGDVVARLRDMQVLKLSNLDRRLGFFIAIMNAVDLKPDMGDTLPFRDGTVLASVRGDALELKTVRFGGSRVSVDGKGSFDMADKRLRLGARVATPFGMSRDVSIDMVLSEEKSS
ncbi:AsmA-like C-terminal region-containing protein [Pseudodesulfovibrio methanolicus]|uniref:AsmA-like C-terminal region-containing protein n=1 Tax=Pseudodesulfovibrio methanolicus TaxID=3126690 RepID=A0ABZ2J0E8_9BACT